MFSFLLYSCLRSVKRIPAMRETQVRFLGREDPLKKEMAIHSSALAWKIPWMEEPDRLQSMGPAESDTTERPDFMVSVRRIVTSNFRSYFRLPTRPYLRKLISKHIFHCVKNPEFIQIHGRFKYNWFPLESYVLHPFKTGLRTKSYSRPQRAAPKTLKENLSNEAECFYT